MLDIEIESKRENKLLDRTEVRFVVNHGGDETPTRDAVRESLASSLGAAKDEVILHRLASDFGRGRSEGYAKIYPSTDEARRVERRYVLARNGLAEAKETADTSEEPAEPAEETGGEAEEEAGPEAEA